MRNVVLAIMIVSLSGCSIFGGKKTRLVPQAYMPEAPAILMQPPKELKTIKKSNLTVTETSVVVEEPKK